MPVEGAWFHVGMSWYYYSGVGEIYVRLYVNGDQVDSFSGSSGDPTIGGDAPIVLAVAALKNYLAGGDVSIAKPKSFITGEPEPVV